MSEHQELIEEGEQFGELRRKQTKFAAFFGVVILLLVVGAGWYAYADTSGDNKDSVAAAATQARVDALESYSSQVRAQLERCTASPEAQKLPECQESVLPDDLDLTPKVTEDGDSSVVVQPVPPSAGQVQIALSRFCESTGSCNGEDGTDASDPTVGQLIGAVTAFCNTDGRCDAEDGTDGTNGTNGTDGGQGDPGAPGGQGERGPGPTDEQVAGAVAAYCEANGCGTDGTDGTNGVDGEDFACPAGYSLQAVEVATPGLEGALGGARTLFTCAA